jgi:hypothetical protein
MDKKGEKRKKAGNRNGWYGRKILGKASKERAPRQEAEINVGEPHKNEFPTYN